MSTTDTGPWGLWHPEKGWAYTSEIHVLLAYEAKLDADDECEHWSRDGYTVRSFTAAAVEAERERLAQWCERNQMGTNLQKKGPYAGYAAIEFYAEAGGSHTGHGYAAAIRAGEGEK